MALYRCTLIRNGVVLENFLREGTSKADVYDGLQLFQWPDGEWTVEQESTNSEEARYG